MIPYLIGRDDYLEVIQREGTMVASLPPAALPVPVPVLEGWDIERVVRHLGRVHRWATKLLEAPADADPNEVAAAAPALPNGEACLDAYAEALHELLASLSTVDPDQRVASFVGATQARFWLRRQAHELTIHRLDADAAREAAGGPSPEPLDRAAAADGVAEWLDVFVATRHVQRHGALEGDLCGRRFVFNCIDDDRVDSFELTITESGSSRSSVVSGRAAPADVTFDASPDAMLLTLWRRRPLETVTVGGNRTLAALLYDTCRF